MSNCSVVKLGGMLGLVSIYSKQFSDGRLIKLVRSY